MNPMTSLRNLALGRTAPSSSAGIHRIPMPLETSSDDSKLKGSGDPKDFCIALEPLFDKLDKNKDGKLDLDEVKASMGDSALKGADAAAVSTLYSALKQQAELKNGLTKELLKNVKEGDSSLPLNSFLGGIFLQQQKALEAKSRDLFNGEPDAMAVKQGRFGTCYFISAMVHKAQLDPAALRKMIKDNGNGTYTVTFAGAKPVTVNAPTDTELLMKTNAGQNGTWATVLETAYARMRNKEAWLPYTEAMDKVEGGRGSDGISAFSKNGADNDMLTLTSEATTRRKLQSSVSQRKMITAGLNKDLIRTSPIQDGHEYTVIGYDRESDTVTIRNPWGTGGNRAEPQNADGTAKDGKMDGVFKLTVREFRKMFSDVTYEQ